MNDYIIWVFPNNSESGGVGYIKYEITAEYFHVMSNGQIVFSIGNEFIAVAPPFSYVRKVIKS